MVETYEEAVAWVQSRLRFGIQPGLERMTWMMEKLNHPERRLRVVHVAGTNGKGSTIAFLRAIMQEADYEVGTFTSPYFERFTERISVNGVPLPDEDLITLVNLIQPLAEELEATSLGELTEFEALTVMAFVYFGTIRPVDIVLLEVGLGGRLDSTNIIHPILSVLTSIGLDHTNILGKTVTDVAGEKAGIIRKGVPVITGVKEGAALQVIEKETKAARAPLYRLGAYFTLDGVESLPSGERFSFDTVFESFTDLETSLLGKHQVENASLAVMVAVYLKNYVAFDIPAAAIRKGIKAAYWPGRFEVISTEPLVIIDGAHNEQGIDSFVASIKERYENHRVHLLFSALHDKELAQMIGKLDEVADEITFVGFDFPRAAKAGNLYEQSKAKVKHLHADWQVAIQNKLATLGKEDVFLITGSLYFIAQVKPFLQEQIAGHSHKK